MTTELVRNPAAHGLGLPQLPARLQPVTTTRSICGFCGTGCSLQIHLDAEGRAINVAADPSYPVNLGMACPKGWEALTPLAAADRATSPLLRNKITGALEPVFWPEALQAFVENFKGIQSRHGAHAISFLSTGQIPTEEMALLGALFKFGMGGLHCDSNTRQCMASAHVAYKQAFGFDSPPFTYKDFEEGDVLVFIGANPAIAHPIMWQRVMMNPHNPEIIVIDPRRTETAAAATQHLAIRPRSDLWLLYGVAHLLVKTGRIKKDFLDAHTTGFAEFAAFVASYTPERVAAETGLDEKTIHSLADTIAGGRAVSFWWTMGVNQGYEAVRTIQAVINLALMTGNIGRPGTGANSITGQCNAMGSRLYANVTSLPGGRDFAKVEHRTEVAQILGIPLDRIPTDPSLAYDQIIDGIESGKIRGLWIIATNTAHSWINSSRFQKLREKLEFLVVQDMYATTESARLADLVLPAAGWGEKEGFFINSERRLGAIRKVARAPGQALSDFAIFKLIAEAWGCGDLFRRWSSPAAAFQLIKELSRGRPCDITGIRDHDHLEAAGGIQWPYPEEKAERLKAEGLNGNASELGRVIPNAPVGLPSPTTSSSLPPRPSPTLASAPSAFSPSALQPFAPAERERRLFADGKFFTPDGRARILFDAPRPMPEPPDAEFPFLLNSGRGTSAQWHTGSRSNKSDVLRKLAPTQPYVEIHPKDAARLGLTDGEVARIASRRGSVTALAVVTPIVRPGEVFMAMHFAVTNQLTFPAFDPHSREPSYKACAVRIDRQPAP
jgi:ferredoxin-nitrate reductase